MANEQKTEAPERFWLWPDDDGDYCHISDNSNFGGTEYIRTDLANAAVGATVRACAEAILHDHTKPDDNRLWGDDRPYICEENAYRTILALEPDAQQALDKLLAAAERKGMERATEAICDYMSDPDSDGDSYYIDAIRRAALEAE